MDYLDTGCHKYASFDLLQVFTIIDTFFGYFFSPRSSRRAQRKKQIVGWLRQKN
ncbi:hypothetical protein D1AOALGA4SA_2149 [Olavius algarvensis Delta 1 endosymbiont]|nr:hypothetical protein D1AOALGA4SA_2149 [Olavius algarvensis Delta 1 endosymbiont]